MCQLEVRDLFVLAIAKIKQGCGAVNQRKFFGADVIRQASQELSYQSKSIEQYF